MSEFRPFGVTADDEVSKFKIRGTRHTLRSVPSPHPDLTEYFLWERAGKITQIVGETEEIDSDERLSRAQEVYFELLSILTPKYGETGSPQEWIDEDAWSSLVTGQKQLISVWLNFKDDLPLGIRQIILALDALSCGKSKVWLSYQFGEQRKIAGPESYL